MDGPKLFAENNEQLEKLLKVFHKFSKNIIKEDSDTIHFLEQKRSD